MREKGIRDRTAAVLLAAGSGARFGGDKLAAAIGGETLLSLAARTVAASGCGNLVVVVSRATNVQAPFLMHLGFHVIVNDSAGEGISSSIRAAIGWAEERNLTTALIALGDMPFVPAAHIARLFEKFGKSANGVAYSVCAGRRSPPAIFATGWFAQLRTLDGDCGARALLAAAPPRDGVEADADVLADIDSREDLIRHKG